MQRCFGVVRVNSPCPAINCCLTSALVKSLPYHSFGTRFVHAIHAAVTAAFASRNLRITHAPYSQPCCHRCSDTEGTARRHPCGQRLYFRQRQCCLCSCSMNTEKHGRYSQQVDWHTDSLKFRLRLYYPQLPPFRTFFSKLFFLWSLSSP